MVHSPIPPHVAAAHGRAPGTPGSPHMRSPVKYTRPSNTLITTLPGFTQPVALPFPEKCLPVCIRCKKNYKTRELCRVRDGHTDLPWSLTYVCVTLDESCIDHQTGRVIDGPFDSRSLDFHQPFCEKEAVPGSTPICASCKEKNYTRAYCREKQKHNQLPWSTVYVHLTRAHTGGPSVPVPESPGAGSVRSREDRGEKDEANCRSPKKQKTVEGSVSNSPTSVPHLKVATSKEDKCEVESDPLFPVPQSRTFLLEVSGKSTVLRWLDIDPKNSKEPLRPTLYKTKVDDRTLYSPIHTSPGATWGNSPGSCTPSYGPPPRGYGIPPPGPYGPPPYPTRNNFTAGPPPHYAHPPPALPPPPSQWAPRQDRMPSLPPYRSQAPHPSYYHQPEEMPSLPPPPPMEYQHTPEEKRSYTDETFGPHTQHHQQVQQHEQQHHHQQPHHQPHQHNQQHQQYQNNNHHQAHRHDPPPLTPPSSASSHQVMLVTEADKTSPEYAGFEPPPSSTGSAPTSATMTEPVSPNLYALTEVASWQHTGAPSWISGVEAGCVQPCDTWGEPLDFTKGLSGQASPGPDDYALAQATSGMGLDVKGDDITKTFDA